MIITHNFLIVGGGRGVGFSSLADHPQFNILPPHGLSSVVDHLGGLH